MKKQVFARGVCSEKLFFIFLVASIIGSIYEQTLNLIRVYLRTHTIVWENRRGVIYGPFNVVYGFGAVILTLIFIDKDYTWYEIFLYSSLLGGIIEYTISYLQEKFTQTISWDYSQKFLNINGRTTIPYMLFWGLFSLFFTFILYPFFSHLIELIPFSLGLIIYRLLLIFMLINMFLSWGAILRQTLRRNNHPPQTLLGRFFDKYYPDNFLKKYFPNMKWR